MSSTHTDTNQDEQQRDDQHPNQEQSQPQPTEQHTAPLWYGEPRFAQRTATPDTGEAGAHHMSGYPAPQGDAGYAGSPAAPTQQFPGGGSPGYPSGTATGAQPDPRNPRNRRLTELISVAALAALLASGGTYAATQLGSDTPSSSAASSSSSSLGRGTPGPVKQADPNNPNWAVTSAAVAPSVVSIAVQTQGAAEQGSGVIIDAKGHVLTNNHVVSGATEIKVTLNDGRTYGASVVGTDPSTDLAVISIKNPPSDLAPIAFGNSDALKVGDPVMAVGNPLGLAGTVTTGIVSALNRPVTTTNESQQQDPFGQQGQTEPVVTNAIQTSAAINPGNSGGALVNGSGQLVGINSSIASLGSSVGGQSGSIGIGFAIPINEAKSIAQQLIDKGKAQHAYLGVSSRDGSASNGSAQRAGAEIVTVQPGTPAAEAGLKTGDVIVAVNGESVGSSESLVAYIRERTVGDQVKLTVLRGGKSIELTASLAVKPS